MKIKTTVCIVDDQPIRQIALCLDCKGRGHTGAGLCVTCSGTGRVTMLRLVVDAVVPFDFKLRREET